MFFRIRYLYQKNFILFWRRLNFNFLIFILSVLIYLFFTLENGYLGWVGIVHQIYLFSLTVMLFIGLSSGRDEYSLKTMMVNRSLPVHPFEDYLAGSLSLFTLGFIIFSGMFLVTCIYVSQAGTFEWKDLRFTKFEKDGIFQSSDNDFWKISLSRPLKKDEHIAIVPFLFKLDGRFSIHSSALIELDDAPEYKIESVLNFKRETVLPKRWIQNRTTLLIPKDVIIEDEKYKLIVQDSYKKVYSKYSHIYLLNLIQVVAFHILLLSLVTICLGKSVSIEVGVFFIAGLLSVQYLIGTMGLKILEDFKVYGVFQTHLHQTMWWEPLLAKLSHLILGLDFLFEWYKSPNIFNALRQQWWISSPWLDWSNFVVFIFMVPILYFTSQMLIRRP